MTQLNLSGSQSTNTQQKPTVEPKDESIKNQTVGALGALAMFAAVIVIGSCSRSDKPVAAQQAVQPAAAVSTPAVQAPVPAAATEPVAGKAKAKKSRAATLSYVNRDYGLSFNFPRTYRLTPLDKKTDTETEAAAAVPAPFTTNFVHSGGVALAALEMPGNSYPGTDFKSAFVNVSVNPGMTSEACAQFALPEAVTATAVSSPDAPSPVAPLPVKIGAIEFHEVENSDAAMMKQTDAKYYHAFSNGACYEFALGIGTGGDGAVEVKPVDRGEVFGKLEKILASVKLRPAVTPETRAQVPAAAATAPADSSTTTEHEAAKPNF